MVATALWPSLFDKYAGFTKREELTLTGGVINDVYRAVGTQGDGANVGEGAGSGIWEAGTNRTINGNATSNTTGITDNSSTTSRVTTGAVKFGTTAFSVISSNLAANEGPSQAISGGAAATQYTVSAWVWLVSGAATVRATLYDSVSLKQGGTALALATTPQRVTVTATTGGASAGFASFIETTVQQVGTWRIGGWQVETWLIAAPYVQTDGATATRDEGVVTATASLLDETVGGIAIRWRSPWTTPQTATSGRFFEWGTITTNVIYVGLSGSGAGNSSLYITRHTTTAVGHELTPNVGKELVAGTKYGVIATWSATGFSLSLDGGTFATFADTLIPVISDTVFDIGGSGAGSQVRGAYIWLATFSKTLSDSDAAQINVMGDVPNYRQLRNMGATGVIDFREYRPFVRLRAG